MPNAFENSSFATAAMLFVGYLFVLYFSRIFPFIQCQSPFRGFDALAEKFPSTAVSNQRTNYINIPHRSCRLPIQFPLFMQCDPRWGKIPLGTSKKNTICTAGCLMSSVSMSLFGCNLTIDGAESNPKTLNAWLTTHGGYAEADLFVWQSVDKLGFQWMRFGNGTATDNVDMICDGNIVILNVDNGHHWVLAIGVNEDDTYQVHDPYFQRTTYHFSDVGRSGIYHGCTK